MKSGKTIFALGLFALLLSTTSPASAHGSGRGQSRNIEQHIEHLTARAGLSAQQVAKVRTILSTEASQLAAMRQNEALSREERHSQRRSIHQATRTAIEALLTTQQKASLQAARAEHAKSKIARRVDHLRTALALRADQVQAITAILESAHAKVAALHQASEAGKREKHQELRASTRAAIVKVLDASQQAQFAEMHEHREGKHHGRGHGPN